MRYKLRDGIDESLDEIKVEAEQNISSKFRVRTGKGLRTVKIERARIRGRRIFGLVKSVVFYMLFHEKGVMIRPKRKKYLAIPHPDGTIRYKREVRLPQRQWFKPAWESKIATIRGILGRKIREAFI